MALDFFKNPGPKRFSPDNFRRKTFEGEAGVAESPAQARRRKLMVSAMSFAVGNQKTLLNGFKFPGHGKMVTAPLAFKAPFRAGATPKNKSL